jgi:hypothetical protein
MHFLSRLECYDEHGKGFEFRKEITWQKALSRLCSPGSGNIREYPCQWNCTNALIVKDEIHYVQQYRSIERNLISRTTVEDRKAIIGTHNIRFDT